ncbi:hypothetical protein ACIQWN_00780 [Streptomyces vinaceus]|uniref:hypothetical protein n=1 Tax=Streptomyces vinaceus TaxID=1960 RepID=UPI0037F704FA
MARVRDAHGILLAELDMGGGHGVAYRPGSGYNRVGRPAVVGVHEGSARVSCRRLDANGSARVGVGATGAVGVRMSSNSTRVTRSSKTRARRERRESAMMPPR